MSATAAPSRPRRLCRTPEECFRAGWDDGADDAPLTDRQIERIARLLVLNLPENPAA